MLWKYWLRKTRHVINNRSDIGWPIQLYLTDTRLIRSDNVMYSYGSKMKTLKLNCPIYTFFKRLFTTSNKFPFADKGLSSGHNWTQCTTVSRGAVIVKCRAHSAEKWTLYNWNFASRTLTDSRAFLYCRDYAEKKWYHPNASACKISSPCNKKLW